MLAQDVNPKVMQEILGHSQIAMTLDLYSHLMPTAKRDVAARMDALLTGTE
jgi:integrase